MTGRNCIIYGRTKSELQPPAIVARGCRATIFDDSLAGSGDGGVTVGHLLKISVTFQNMGYSTHRYEKYPSKTNVLIIEENEEPPVKLYLAYQPCPAVGGMGGEAHVSLPRLLKNAPSYIGRASPRVKTK